VAGPSGRIIAGRQNAAEISVSDDGGETWASQALEGKAIENLTVDPRTSRVVYAMVNGGGIYRSEDGGLVWQRVPEDLRNALPVFAAVSADGVVYVSGESTPVLHSADNGATWLPLSASPAVTVTQLAWSDAGLLVGATDGLWLWSPLSGWQRLLEDSGGAVFGLTAYGDAVFAGAMNGLWRIQAGQAMTMTEIIITDIEQIPGNPTIFVAGTNKGSFVWWQEDDKSVEEFYFGDPGEGERFIMSLLVDPMHVDRIFASTLTGIYRGNAQAWIEEKQ
jgi:hypothetical protein